MSDDALRPIQTPPPTEPGFYKYDGGRQTMMFLRDYGGQWYTIFDTGTMHACEWSYIEQALSEWNLVKVVPQTEDAKEKHGAFSHMRLPVYLPGNNRNWEHVDGTLIIKEHVSELVLKDAETQASLLDMAKRNILVGCAFDYKLKIDETHEKINTQFAKEVPADIVKVSTMLASVISGRLTVPEVLEFFAEEGVLFREEK